MSVLISSRFIGPREVREADGRFEAVLPEPTQFEFDLQQRVMASKLDAAEARTSAARMGWLARRRDAWRNKSTGA